MHRNNIIDGGAGADSMNGGLGNDTYYVDNTGDVVVDSGGDADMVYTSASYILADGIENMTATGAAAISLTGNAFNNTLMGNAGANAFNGGFGHRHSEWRQRRAPSMARRPTSFSAAC